MIKIYALLQLGILIWSLMVGEGVCGQALDDSSIIEALPDIGHYRHGRQRRQNGNNGQKDTSAFNIVNGQILTPGLAIIDSPQPFTPMGGDFLQIALDISGDGKLPVAPQSTDDPISQLFNITIFLTSNTLQKNFTITNITTAAPPLANIMIQEPGSTVKHVNFEWPDCLVGDNNSPIGSTSRGDYNISIHQNFRVNGTDHYSIFNLPISITNSITQFPGAGQLTTKPPPGPLSANGGRMPCSMISNPMMNLTQLINSVNNPPGQPYQDIPVQTSKNTAGGTIGNPGSSSPSTNGKGGSNTGGAPLGAGVSITQGGRHLRLTVLLTGLVTVITAVAW